MTEENIYIKHAKREFEAAGWTKEGVFDNDMQELMCKQVIELLNIFSTHGHSGSSAPYAISMFKALASFEPLVPLTGDDSEWNEISEGCFQNIRCSHVFKDNGQAFDIQGKIFREPSGCCYSSKDSHVNITFPYTPKIEYINVNEKGEPLD